jgi:serine/threonine protein kinase
VLVSALEETGSLTTRMLGNHELLIRLASGGAANVFLVRDTAAAPPGRLLALKILLPSLAANEDFLNMFFTEAKIAARLEHQNIVAIAGFGQVEGIHCLAMEYVFGASLAQVLRASARAKKPLTVGVLLRITAQVCDALHYAHELQEDDGKSMGLVHRDVTPQNILIGFNGVPKLTDFGIAKATNRGWETQAGIVKGKFSYMSPEQAMGKRVDRRSDIFGAGIVLWEALTGRDLFRGTSPLEVLTAIREQKIEPPSKVVPGLTPIVDPIVMKALRRSPRARYQTALEMKQEIEELIQRAGVTIDANTISREFAAIYGDEIVDRAFALRAAMAGRADLEQLAQVLGGSILNPKHLPVIPGGLTNPDPLGLFSPEPHRVEEEEVVPSNGAVPARLDQPFTLPSAMSMDAIEVEDPVELLQDGPSIDIADIEPDIPNPRPLDPMHNFLKTKRQGWDDSTAMSVPHDELLSMLSEDDATIGYLPPQFAARFGAELRNALEDSGEQGNAHNFDDEMTVGMTSTGTISRPRAIRSEDTPSPWGSPMPHYRTVIPQASTEPSSHGNHRSLRPMPRAPSLDLDRSKKVPARPIPRAPSLDMDGDIDLDGSTPAPDIEDSRPPPSMPPPPPPARLASHTPIPRVPSSGIGSFHIEEVSEPPAEVSFGRRPSMGPTLPPLANSERDPKSMPGMPVIDPMNGASPDPTTPGMVEDSFDSAPIPPSGVFGEDQAEMELGTEDSSGPIEELPPLSPNALRALANASSPFGIPESAMAPMHTPQPQPISGLRDVPPPNRGLVVTPAFLILLVLGLVSLGVVIGVLVTR